MKNLKLKTIVGITFLLLLIPFIAMQFTNEVNWGVLDFIIAGILIFTTSLLINFTFIKTKKSKYRNYFILFIVIIFILIWAELAVGIFGSPFAGS